MNLRRWLSNGMYLFLLTTLSQMVLISFDIRAIDKTNITALENAEDGNTKNWSIYDNTPVGKIKNNIDPANPANHVIKLETENTGTGFKYTFPTPVTDNFIMEWKQKSGTYVVYLSCTTTYGHRYVYYTKDKYNKPLNKKYIHHGLSPATARNNWTIITRDVEKDLKDSEPENNLISINAFLFRGSGYIDDIKTVDNISKPELYLWEVYNNTPQGTIKPILNPDNSEEFVVELSGDSGTSTGFRKWLLPKITDNFNIEWNMKYDNPYKVYFSCKTTLGHRYLYYTNSKTDKLGNEKYIHHGLGPETSSGSWITIRRNLEEDLNEAQPDNNIISIEAFLIRGSGLVGDISTYQNQKIYKTDYQVTETWNNGFNGKITITNLTDKTLSGWYIDFDCPYEMIDIWNAETVSHKDNHYKIKNGRWNKSIDPGESVNFGFSIEPGDPAVEPSNITVVFDNQSNISNPPVAQNDHAITEFETPVSINVLDNDTGSNISILSVSSPTHGSTKISENTVIFTPNTNFAGNDEFTYKIIDASLQTANATVNVTVNNGTPENIPPTITFNSPQNNELIIQESLSPITLSVSASDSDGTIESIIFNVDGQTFTGYTAQWTPSVFNTYTITATAKDNLGATATNLINIEIKKDKQQSEIYSFPQHIAYPLTHIRPNNYTQSVMDNDVKNLYDYWKQKYLLDAGIDKNKNQMYRISYDGDTVSEGQGYGMIITAIMAGYDVDAKNIFDGLWYYSRNNPSEINSNFMDWSLNDTGGNDSAFDGDTDIAYALLIADKQWGSNSIINYKTEALKIINAIRNELISDITYLPFLGDWVDKNDTVYNNVSRPSDFMLANFRAFDNLIEDEDWEDNIISACQTKLIYLQENFSQETGLIPDFIVNGDPAIEEVLECENDGKYFYNSCRVPLRIGVDALLSNDSVSKEIALKISDWVKYSTGGNIDLFYAGYNLNGTAFANYSETSFTAPIGVAAMCAEQQTWLNHIYASVRTKRTGTYYEDTLNLISILIMTGNFWDSTTSH